MGYEISRRGIIILLTTTIQKRIRVVKKEKYNSVYQAYISLY